MKKKKISKTLQLRHNIKQTIRRAEKKGVHISEKIKADIEGGSYQTLKSYQRNKYAKLYKGTSLEKRKVNKKSPTEIERRRVLQTIYRAEKKGIRFSDELKQKIKSAPYQTLKSYRRNKYARLYSEGTALSEEGAIITGEEFRSFLKKRAIERAQETRRRRRLEEELRTGEPRGYEPLPEYTPPSKDEDFDEYIRQRDEQTKALFDNEEFQKNVSEGEIIYQNVRSFIQQFENVGAGQTGKHFYSMLDEYIEAFGKDNLMSALAEIGDEFEQAAENVIWYGGDKGRLSRAAYQMSDMLQNALGLSGDHFNTELENALSDDLEWEDYNEY